jgi:enoyl-CoA hydratase
VLILTGAGEVSFCAGADLKEIATLAGRLEHPGAPLGLARAPRTKPAIAVIGGWCLAGGFELALWCDLRIAAEGVTFGMPERRWGVPLIDGGTQRLPRIVGLGRALDLISRAACSAIDGLGMALEDGLAFEAQSGPPLVADAAAGAARFAGGEGRGGAGAGV